MSEAPMIIVMGYVHLDPSDVDEFLADIQVIAPGTRAEKGCLFMRWLWTMRAPGACWLPSGGKINTR